MKRRIILPLLLLSISMIAIKVSAQDGNTYMMLQPPPTEKKPKTTEINGDRLVHNYFWLREKTNPAVIARMVTENANTAPGIKPTETLQDKLNTYILTHIAQTHTNV